MKTKTQKPKRANKSNYETKIESDEQVFARMKELKIKRLSIPIVDHGFDDLGSCHFDDNYEQEIEFDTVVEQLGEEFKPYLLSRADAVGSDIHLLDSGSVTFDAINHQVLAEVSVFTDDTVEMSFEV